MAGAVRGKKMIRSKGEENLISLDTPTLCLARAFEISPLDPTLPRWYVSSKDLPNSVASASFPII